MTTREEELAALEDLLSKQFSMSDPPHPAFVSTEWTVQRQTGTVVAALHRYGHVRKLPAAWFR